MTAIDKGAALKASRYSIPTLMERGLGQTSGDRMLSIAAVVCKVGASRASIYAWMDRPDVRFPRCRRLGPRRVGWIASEVDGWLAERAAA